MGISFAPKLIHAIFQKKIAPTGRFNSGERGRSARQLGTLRAKAEGWRLKRNGGVGKSRLRRFEINVMRDRPGGRSAAERAGREFGVRPGVVMRPSMVKRMRCRHSRQSDGTQFQSERYTACRHEAGRYIGAKQKQGQHQQAGPASSLAIDGSLTHQGAAKLHTRECRSPGY